MTQIQHEFHELAVASQHIHLDHDNCLETVVLKGRIDEVRACADRMVSETAVRHGNVHLVPVEIRNDTRSADR
jgi:CopG family nickel-responsive transcriptional regulator